MDVNLIAVVLSVLALASSVYLAAQQSALQRKANYLPAYIEMLGQFRSMEFNDHYRFVTQDLAGIHDPQLGLCRLPDDARAAVYDTAYYFQNFVALYLLGIIDDQIIATMHVRIVAIWNAVAPYVHRERETNPTTGPHLLLVLEVFATAPNDLSARPFHSLLGHRRTRRRLARAAALTAGLATAGIRE